MITEKQLADFGHLICAVAKGEEMNRTQARDAYRQVILNEQPELQQGAFLAAHISRGPTTEELSGAWDALDQYDTAKIEFSTKGAVCDIVGTGSDSLKTINCSTPAALIASACGLPVAKKGARLVTGVSGASDVLEILGIDLNSPLERAEECLCEHGICYLPGEAFLKSGWARLIQSMRFTSAFNIIGPLTRPCDATNLIVIGGYSPHVCDQLIDVLKEIDMPVAAAPFGMADGIDETLGMDEISTCGKTRMVELKHGEIDVYDVFPEDFGVKRSTFEAIASGKTARDNARKILDTLNGEYETPVADFFCVNAAVALKLAGFASDYSKGVDLARETLANGKALEKLEGLREKQAGQKA